MKLTKVNRPPKVKTLHNMNTIRQGSRHTTSSIKYLHSMQSYTRKNFMKSECFVQSFIFIFHGQSPFLFSQIRHTIQDSNEHLSLTCNPKNHRQDTFD